MIRTRRDGQNVGDSAFINLRCSDGWLIEEAHQFDRHVTRRTVFISTRNEAYLLYIHVTVHRNRFLFNNQLDALINQMYSVIKLYMFRSGWTLLGYGHHKYARNLPVPNVQ
jgi:hypothetical protein